MKIIVHKTKLKELIHNEKNLGFVPTMGAIHQGHISLIKKSIKQINYKHACTHTKLFRCF